MSLVLMSAIKFFLLPAIIDGYYKKCVIKYRNLESDHEY